MGKCFSKSETPPKEIDYHQDEPDPGRYHRHPGPSGPSHSPPSPVPPFVSHHDIQLAIEQGRKIVRGLHDYSTENVVADGEVPDLNFTKGDVMEILSEDGDWWLAVNMATLEKGYVPYTYVALENSLQQFDWFHGKIGRKDAEKFLLDERNIQGSFLVRESDTLPGSYCLSVLDIDMKGGGSKSVKHYRIKDLDNGGCFISTKVKCCSVGELVRKHSEEAEGLCSRLTTECRKVKPVMGDLSRQVRDKWEIDRNTLQMLQVLGAGHFGEVYRGLWKGRIDVAIKTLKTGTMSKEKFMEEARTMKELRHPKIVKLFAVCSIDEPIYIVTELMINGSLSQFLKDDNGRTVHWNMIIDIAAQVADGMNYIEGRNYIHRDLAARNILVGQNGIVKIGDFGLARAIEEDIYTAHAGAKIPIRWTAPEALGQCGDFTIKSDVWAFGILLVEIVTFGQLPYPDLKTNREVREFVNRGRVHPQPVNCSTEMYDVMVSCWHKRPDCRPTFETIFHTLDDFIVATGGQYAQI